MHTGILRTGGGVKDAILRQPLMCRCVSMKIYVSLAPALHRKLITKYARPYQSKRGFWKLCYVQSKEIIPWVNYNVYVNFYP